MWDPLQRARRLLRRDDQPTDRHGAVAIAAAARQAAGAVPLAVTVSDVTFALGRAELERLIGALEGLAGEGAGRADTPATLEAALRTAIARVGGVGEPHVTRRPAGVYTPEAWQIAIDRADERTRATIEAAIRTGGRDE